MPSQLPTHSFAEFAALQSAITEAALLPTLIAYLGDHFEGQKIDEIKQLLFSTAYSYLPEPFISEIFKDSLDGCIDKRKAGIS